MNLASINPSLINEILSGIECIGFFVHNKNYYWIIDWEAHFNLDQKKNFDALLMHKFFPISKEEYEDCIKKFRDGIVILYPELFPKYINNSSAKLVTTEMLSTIFFDSYSKKYKYFLNQIENCISSGESLDDDNILIYKKLFCMLPKFYVNYDRKIFFHMIEDRAYEDVVINGWLGEKRDFQYMIPRKYRYWIKDNIEDYWCVNFY